MIKIIDEEFRYDHLGNTATEKEDYLDKTMIFRIKDIEKDNDELYKYNGKKCKVLSYDKNQDTYEIEFSDGSEYDAFPEELVGIE